ncbi:MAG TPA: SpoIID/LytB domain-containing protein, partial [Bacteroidales bacterium]|nr:SpoIID/LytB domain-containing protein [Bacteroidales bacterium]
SIGVYFPQPYTLNGQPAEADQNTTLTSSFTVRGTHTLTHQSGLILFDGQAYESLRFDPIETGDVFELENVRIGIGFHWERTEKQVFEGSLIILTDEQALTAVNRVPLEAYLTSVISSEMSANASAALLKAHAVISRSWLLAQLQQKGKQSNATDGMVDNATTRIRWYDREDHDRFDVCADDHCQRYQGLLEVDTPQVKTALSSTQGMVLCSGEDICDARFSKCCGGLTESFESCWADTRLAYLVSKPDLIPAPDRSSYADPEGFILGNPPSFCNTNDKGILEQVLKDYDFQTRDFFRWTVSYDARELSDLFKQRSGLDLGLLSDLEALERGGSGRIVRLKVTGSKGSLIIGKELEIRRCLSKTHLYSSAFVVDKVLDEQGKVRQFILHGAGWGHGVGLCQIGAAVMAEQGYKFEQILEHYYPNTQIKQLYDS